MAPPPWPARVGYSLTQVRTGRTMDHERFDTITRSLSSLRSRRGLIRFLGGVAVS